MMTPGIGRRWWFRFFVTTALFSAVHCAVISTAVAGQRANNNATVAVNIGVILDLSRTDLVGRVGLSCVEMAVADFYASHPDYTTRLVINTRDSRRDDVVQAAASALDLIENVHVQAILGPQTSMQANFLIPLGEKAQVPIISFSASSPTLASIGSPYFFRATQNDLTQVNAIAAIVKAFGWRQVVPIYVGNAFGEGIVPSLVHSLDAVDARVPYCSAISPSATDAQIRRELKKLITMQTRVFVVHMSPNLGARFFVKVKEAGMMSASYVWIVTAGIADFLNSVDDVILDSMQGVLGVKPSMPQTKEVSELRVRWKRDHPEILINSYGLWAYDATVALAIAVERTAGATDFMSFVSNNKNNVSTTNLFDLERIGVWSNGPNLVQKLSKTRFGGLSGEFVMEADGQLRASAYEVVNVNGNGIRVVGFWTPDNSSALVTSSTTSRASLGLGTVIWPGDPGTAAPKGFAVTKNGREKLRIGVPVKEGFREFVSMTTNHKTNRTNATGYSIEIFEAVVGKLPYALQFEYVPFATPEGDSAGSYNDLVDQVFYGKFDAVVGDITIIANRSNYVDFTLPYTESGVLMVVPMQPNGSKDAWLFLKPLTWDLWVTTFFFFLFIGFVVWALEHRISKDFRGPPSHQAGTSLWFSFSTMLFAHRETVVSNLTRTVVIIWCFVLLIITQSYTANFTSMLTVQQLRPTVTDMKELLMKGAVVGYHDASFVLDLLREWGFRKDKLVPFNSTENWDSLFRRGAIMAAFDEVPYIKLFLAKYCSKYMMIDPTYKTDGFGFVFPKGSPIVADISRAVLKVTESTDQMSNIEERWLGRNSKCPPPESSSGSQLGLNSFWSLFLIAGVAAVSALCIFGVTFVYQHRKLLLLPQEDDSHSSNPSLWRRILNLLKTFDKKDVKCHTFCRDDKAVSAAEVNLAGSSVMMMSPNATYSVDTTTTELPVSTPPMDSPAGLHGEITADDQESSDDKQHIDQRPNSNAC